MAKTPSATSKVQVDPNFEGQIRQLRQRAKEESEALRNGGQTQWLMPDSDQWAGDLFDIEALSEPFVREQANDQFEEATKDPTDSGVVGDLITTTLQVDYLACMERAFRARHTMRRPRTFAHAASRKRGHGDERGTLTQANLEYIRNTIALSQANGGSD